MEGDITSEEDRPPLQAAPAAVENDTTKQKPVDEAEGVRQLESVVPPLLQVLSQKRLTKGVSSSKKRPAVKSPDDCPPGVTFIQYESELQLPDIMRLMKADLSEPYSIYTYRYFIHNWPNLCFLAVCDGEYVGAVVCKMETYTEQSGYIAMLAVDKDYRKRKIGSTLVKMTIEQMATEGCSEVVLETEVTNKVALSLYENLGFVRERYLHQYYLNGVDAYRLKLWLRIIQ